MLQSAAIAFQPARRRLLLGGTGLLFVGGATAQTPTVPALADVLESARQVSALRAVTVMRDGQLLAQRFTEVRRRPRCSGSIRQQRA